MDTFAEYMEQVLYGPEGYYSTGAARSGKSGDYFTAPDVGSVFGRLLAGIFELWKTTLAGKTFSVIEAGAGEGRLTQDILNVQPFPYVAVERSPSRLARLNELRLKYPTLYVRSDLRSVDIPSVQGVLVGNELIDAFPVHRIRMKSGVLEEAYVGGAPRAIQWGALSTPRVRAYVDRLRITLPEGYETEVNLAMADWLKEVSQVLEKGIVVLIDYGRPAHEYYAPERNHGTLRTFSQHRVGNNFLTPNALLDLTADVDFTSLALDARAAGFMALAFMEMGTFLMSAIGPGFIPAPKDLVGLRYLLHPEGFGGAFHVLILGKNVDSADWIFEHNRIARLGLDSMSEG